MLPNEKGAAEAQGEVYRFRQRYSQVLSEWHNFGHTSSIAYICIFAADKIVTGQTEDDYHQFAKDLINDILGTERFCHRGSFGGGHHLPTFFPL